MIVLTFVRRINQRVLDLRRFDLSSSFHFLHETGIDMRAQQVAKLAMKHRFWIACSLVTVACIGSWMLASVRLVHETRRHTDELDLRQVEISHVLSTAADIGLTRPPGGANLQKAHGSPPPLVHPNRQTIEGMHKQIVTAAKSMVEAWRIRHEQQKTIVKVAPELPAPTREVLEAHLPEETVLTAGDDPIHYSFRSTFAHRISDRLAALAADIGATLDEAMRPSDANQRTLTKPVVNWEPANREIWSKRLSEFAGRHGNHQTVPTTAQMMIAQQDLWVLENMFQIIQELNGNELANDLVAIKTIDHVLIGKDATVPLGTLATANIRPDTSGNYSAESPAFSAPIPRKGQRSDPGRRPPGLPAFDADASDSPFHGRYVDEHFQPIPVDAVQAVFTHATLSERSSLAVVKRIPVRFALAMDERQLGEFLESAERSPLGFAIRQIRINRHRPNEGVETLNVSSGQSTEANLARGSGGITADGEAPTGSSGTGNAVVPPEARRDATIKVEFIGSVKIVNPVNEAFIASLAYDEQDQENNQ